MTGMTTTTTKQIGSRQRYLERRAQLIAKGLCTDCGKRPGNTRNRCLFCIYLDRVKKRLRYNIEKHGADCPQIVPLLAMKEQLEAGENLDYIIYVLSDGNVTEDDLKPYDGPKRWFDYLDDEEVVICVPKA